MTKTKWKIFCYAVLRLVALSFICMYKTGSKANETFEATQVSFNTRFTKIDDFCIFFSLFCLRFFFIYEIFAFSYIKHFQNTKDFIEIKP